MKHLAILLLSCLAAFLPHNICAQQVEYVDDEECGCELVFTDGIQTTSNGSLFGFKRADGTVIADNIYLHVDKFHGDYCRVYLNDTLSGLIDRDGNQIIPCLYPGVGYPSCGRIMFIHHNQVGYYDMQGHIAIQPSFIQADDFRENRAAVLVPAGNGHHACTFIDTNGHILFPPVFDNAIAYNEGFAPVMQDKKWGLLDTNGHLALPARYAVMTVNDNRHFFAGPDSLMALFNYSMRPLTDFVYDWAAQFSEGRCGVRRNGKYGFVDTSGHESVPCIYDEIGRFSYGRTMVRQGNHYGIIDTNGRIILPVEYDDHTPKGMKYMYFDSLALVERDGKIGYVDLDGRQVVPFYFEEGYNFSQGLAAVRFKGMWGYIDTRGEVYMPFIFDIASPFEWGRAEVFYNGELRKVDLKGKCVKNCKGIIAWRDWTK